MRPCRVDLPVSHFMNMDDPAWFKISHYHMTVSDCIHAFTACTAVTAVTVVNNKQLNPLVHCDLNS